MKRLLERCVPDSTLKHASALNHYIYGEPEIRLMRRLCRPDGISLDIGANIGTYTYFLSRHSASVYAYEPNPELAKRLARRYPKVHVRWAAVSDVQGQVTLQIPVADGRRLHELASVVAGFDHDEIVEHTVPAVTVDSERLSNVGFIKIDAEQHELSVLAGALGTIRDSRPVIMTEAAPLLYDEDLPATFGFVTDLDYEGWFAFEGCHHPFSEFVPEIHANRQQFGKKFMSANIFFFPSERPGSEFLA